jgi:hypothetical protein
MEARPVLHLLIFLIMNPFIGCKLAVHALFLSSAKWQSMLWSTVRWKYDDLEYDDLEGNVEGLEGSYW